MNLTIIKIGGSVITDKKSGKPKINIGNIAAIARVLRNFAGPFILIHGAGSFGHPLVKKTGIDKSVISESQLLAFAKTQALQNQLNYMFCEILVNNGVPAFPAQASSHAIMERGRLIKLDTEAIAGFLRLGVLPVSYGVPAYDKAWGSSILSGDQIAPYMARHLNAARIIEVSDVDGIFTSDPKTDKTAQLVRVIDRHNFEKVHQYLSNGQSADVTGGIKQKYIELLDAAKSGIPIRIVNFKNLKAAIEGRETGTLIDMKGA